jgi:hypothetical protein
MNRNFIELRLWLRLDWEDREPVGDGRKARLVRRLGRPAEEPKLEHLERR